MTGSFCTIWVRHFRVDNVGKYDERTSVLGKGLNFMPEIPARDGSDRSGSLLHEALNRMPAMLVTSPPPENGFNSDIVGTIVVLLFIVPKTDCLVDLALNYRWRCIATDPLLQIFFTLKPGER